MSEKENQELFGTGSMKPDVMKIPNMQQLSSMVNMEEPEDYSQLVGEFKIEKGFAGQQRAAHFSVTNP
jgi:hypothetical protein